MLSLLLPSRPKQPLTLPLIAKIPPVSGRKLANGTLIVEDPEEPDVLYKFTPWQHSQLAWNEIDICAKLNQLDDCADFVQLLGIGATAEYLVRKMQRSHHGALSSFLFNACKGDPDLMRVELVLSLLAQIAHAMMQLHAINIVHRDLKSENILIFGDHPDIDTWPSVQIRISDFDRALEFLPGQFLDAPVGSLLHMAPELLAWEAYDRKVDSYAFGIVMFEIAHGGRMPYYNVSTGLPGGLTSMEFSEKVVNEGLRPDWSYQDPVLKQLAEQCWDKNPDRRPEFSEIFAQLMRHPGMPQAWRRSHHPCKPCPQIDLPGIGFSGDIGGRRSTMEDAACVLKTPNYLLAGVFDGLRDARSSECAARQLALNLAAELEHPDIALETAMTAAFARVNATLQQLAPNIESGTTATIALLSEHEIVVAWLGDSPAWLFRKTGKTGYSVQELVHPHHPDRADETTRMSACGARIAREMRWLDNGEQMPTGPARVFFPQEAITGIALSRALGLFSLHPAISDQTDIIKIARQDDDVFLVLGTDGVFDLLAHADVFDIFMSSAGAAQAADALIADVLRRGAPDNASVVVVDMRKRI